MNRPRRTSKHDSLFTLVEPVKIMRATVAKTKRKTHNHAFGRRVYAQKEKEKTHGGYESVAHGIRLVDLTPLVSVYYGQLGFKNFEKFK